MTLVKERSRNSDELIVSSTASRAELDATVDRLKRFLAALEAEVLRDMPGPRDPGDES